MQDMNILQNESKMKTALGQKVKSSSKPSKEVKSKTKVLWLKESLPMRYHRSRVQRVP